MRTQRRMSRSLLTGAVSLLGLLVLDARNTTRADPAAAQNAVAAVSAEIFGVPLGATPSDVNTVAERAGVTCVQSGETNIVCPSQLALAPVSSAETLWFNGGAVERVYLVA